VERYGDPVRAVALDVTDADAADNAIKAAVDAFGRPDVLVNNPGYYGSNEGVAQLGHGGSESAWQR